MARLIEHVFIIVFRSSVKHLERKVGAGSPEKAFHIVTSKVVKNAGVLVMSTPSSCLRQDFDFFFILSLDESDAAYSLYFSRIHFLPLVWPMGQTEERAWFVRLGSVIGQGCCSLNAVLVLCARTVWQSGTYLRH